MSKYRKMRMIDLYSSLGYERKSSKRKLEDLDAATASFFREYTNQGNRISLSIINIEAARLCALNFLHEDERGEKYWPVTSEEIFQWAKDQDREEITDILTYIFRKKAFSDYVSERKDIRDREAEAGRSRLQKPKSIRKRPRNRKHDDDDSLSATDEGPTQNEKACIPSDLELSTIKFWKDPPEQPSAKYCGTYLQGLNPQLDLEPGLEFRRKWISSRSPKWPISADNRLLRFMFENDLFIAYDHGDEIPAAFLRSLREGTEIEEMSMSEVVKFRNLATGRVRELTHQLTQKPCLILEYRRDGVIRMTERFERFWKKKEVYWEDSPKLTKKHKKSKAVRAKTPLVFPSPREQSNATAELPSAQADTGSRFQLASIAETALNMSTGREELNESRAEQSFFADLMTTCRHSFIPKRIKSQTSEIPAALH
ncbi:hypothetical protein N431DRAFT_545072 [Stipitochalara longipes BDJ]|nr:hypothetical protein N431DRAFT_545072 [Stipitochalara longipes BDJ]